jgi:hypothetical protein
MRKGEMKNKLNNQQIKHIGVGIEGKRESEREREKERQAQASTPRLNTTTNISSVFLDYKKGEWLD